MKQGIKNYLDITKKEWNGLVVLVILIVLTAVTPYVYQLLHKDNTINKKDFDEALSHLAKAGAGDSSRRSKTGANSDYRQVAMFRFDPNTVSIEQWQQLGLSEKQAAVIGHYIAKGGRFYSKQDLKKIYTLSDSDFKRLEPYVDIPKESNNDSKEPHVAKIIEINGADSAKLSKVPGVWPALAKRIFRYKERLGGFVDKQQLKEVYGIDSVKFVELAPYVSINTALIRKININTISLSQFQLFPYLSYKQKNAIIEYHNQHGNYTSIADFKNIAILDEVILRKIEPYLAYK
jgi:competence protein ComEA